MKPDGYASVHRINDVLAHERLVLETVCATAHLAYGVGH